MWRLLSLFRPLSSNLQVCQSLKETKESLSALVKTAGVKEENLKSLKVIGDFSYAWEAALSLEDSMQNALAGEEGAVDRLLPIFNKVPNLKGEM